MLELDLQVLTRLSAPISIVITLVFLLKNIFSFFTASQLERQFFSKEKKFVFTFVNLIFIFIIFPTGMFYAISIDNKNIIIFFIKNFTYFSIVFIASYCSIFIIKLLTLANRKSVFRKNKFFNFTYKLASLKVRNFIIVLFFLSSLIVIGVFNFVFLKNSENFLTAILVLLVFIIIEFFVINSALTWALDVKFTKPILVTIEMENGRKYNNFYIYYPSNKNYILIGKNNSYEDCKEPILLKTEKIVSCEQLDGILRIAG